MNSSSALLNLGCGGRINANWVNVDYPTSAANVIPFDLKQGIPFPDSVFDVVYHSHLLEHFPKEYALTFLKDCYRVLKPEGILRVVVPDLENIARLYLILLEKSLKGDEEAQKRYEWIMLELYDQMVRNHSGGAMLDYWRQNPMPAEDYVIERLGSEVKDAIAKIRSNPDSRNQSSRQPNTAPDPHKIGQFRLSGEIHQWMYDRYSLGKLLHEAGFEDITVCRADESRIPDFNSYLLDIEADGSVRKPDSLFMEARKSELEGEHFTGLKSKMQQQLINNCEGHKMKLCSGDVEWIGVRFLDTVSRAFRYKYKYYKAIFPEYEKHIMSLYHNRIFDYLFSHQLVPKTKISEYCIDNFNLILEQNTEFFSFNSQCWNPYMLRDAALKYIEINRYLLSHNLILKDGHASNIIFQENSIPKWCDIGSIIPGNNDSMTGIREFIQYFVYPLMVREKSISLSRISRYFTQYGCTEEEAFQILKQNIRFNSGRRQVLDDLEAIIHNIKIIFDKTTWSDYHGDLSKKDLDLFEKKKGVSGVDRNEIVKRFLRTFKPKTVLDIGANAGMFSILAAQSGAEVLALEPDESASAKCYQNFRSKDGMKVKVSMESFGAKTNQLPDLVIGMALTHHLFFTHHYRLEIIAKILSNHTKNVLITEFMPNGMGGHVPKPYPLPDNYRLDIFLRELSNYFENVETIDPPRSATSSHRVVIICHNKLSNFYEAS